MAKKKKKNGPIPIEDIEKEVNEALEKPKKKNLTAEEAEVIVENLKNESPLVQAQIEMAAFLTKWSGQMVDNVEIRFDTDYNGARYIQISANVHKIVR
jgi:hypothetical protein